jgi:hypothetical protein
MALPYTERLRVYAHEICNNAYCVKRSLLHSSLFSCYPLKRKTLKSSKDSFKFLKFILAGKYMAWAGMSIRRILYFHGREPLIRLQEIGI